MADGGVPSRTSRDSPRRCRRAPASHPEPYLLLKTQCYGGVVEGRFLCSRVNGRHAAEHQCRARAILPVQCGTACFPVWTRNQSAPLGLNDKTIQAILRHASVMTRGHPREDGERRFDRRNDVGGRPCALNVRQLSPMQAASVKLVV